MDARIAQTHKNEHNNIHQRNKSDNLREPTTRKKTITLIHEVGGHSRDGEHAEIGMGNGATGDGTPQPANERERQQLGYRDRGHGEEEKTKEWRQAIRVRMRINPSSQET